VTDPNDHVPADNLVDRERAQRLREAIRRVGSQAELHRRTGIPVGTLAHYLRGRDMTTATAIQIADACQVRLEWLAAGRGLMTEDWQPPKPVQPAPQLAPSAPAGPPGSLFATVDMDRLAAAIEKARHYLPSDDIKPSPRAVAQIVCILYDDGDPGPDESNTGGHGSPADPLTNQ
jgi:transcriptional regulator with XRE-family HTH domain